jgi:hypothetical protein
MDRRAGCPDASILGAAALGQLLEDALPRALAAWDAWVGARPDAKAGEAHRVPADEDVEKSVGPALVFRVRDASWHWEQQDWLGPWVEPVWTELCIRAAAPSAEQSSAAGAQPRLPGRPDGTLLQAPKGRLQPRSHSR